MNRREQHASPNRSFWQHAMMAAALAFFFLGGASASPAQNFQVLYNFSGCADGDGPSATLLMDRTGDLYGSATQGGLGCGAAGLGVIFRLKRAGPSWLETPLHTFTGDGDDGAYPYNYGGLIFGSDGAIYGTTFAGGASNAGTVFSLRPSATACHSALCLWSETLLFSFSPTLDQPYSGVVSDSAGNLYGTTGVVTGVYQLSSSGGSWRQNVLSNQSTQIFANVTFGPDGNLYGVNLSDGFGYGTVFQVVRSGSSWTTNVLHQFTGADGASPVGGLIFDSAGNLYGSTRNSGPNGGGTVFKMWPDGGTWAFRTIHAFSGGNGPFSALTLDASGNLYGTTYGDGQFGNGMVFRLAPSGDSWTFTDLYDFFVNNDEGTNPVGGVTLDSDGNLYGTASRSGANGAGTVWEITP